MALAAFNSVGDLPPGLHRASLEEVTIRFGGGTSQRGEATATLVQVMRLAQRTGKLDRLIVFGSYVSNKPAPRDVDIILVMSDDFDMRACSESAKALFNHHEAEQHFGASIFWIRPAMLIHESLENFLAHWQLKRDGSQRGIVDVVL